MTPTPTYKHTSQADTVTTVYPAHRNNAEKRRRRAERARQRQQQPQCTTAADGIAAAQPSPPASDAAATADRDVPDDPIIVSWGLQHLSAPQKDQQHKLKQQQQQKQQKRQQQQPHQGTASSAGADHSSSGGSSDSGRLHACVVLDPIYRGGEVVGYFVQRTFLSPHGVKGAPKLVLREVLGLLKAEGRAILHHGPAPTHNIKTGKPHRVPGCEGVGVQVGGVRLVGLAHQRHLDTPSW